jgi:hypothetical protein
MSRRQSWCAPVTRDVAAVQTSRVRCSEATEATELAGTLPLSARNQDSRTDVKKLIGACATFVFAAGCSSAPPTPTPRAAPTTTTSSRVMTGNQTGAADPLTAVRGFMTAVKQTDLQALGAIWGDAQGPARDAYDREQLEKRELIMMCYLKHDRYDIVGDAPGTNSARSVAVNLTHGDVTRATTFTVVPASSGRWYVSNVDLKNLQELCSSR